MKFKASVKVMRSYDYNHFEAILSSDEEKSLQEVNLMRIHAARIVDHAIEQYKEKKKAEAYSSQGSYDRAELEKRVKAIKENFPKSEWTSEQMATVKKLEDLEYKDRWDYDESYGGF